MAFPSSPTPGQTHTEDNTTWVYAGPVNGWYRQSVTPGNSSTFTGGTSGGSATAAGAAGEIQFTDGTNLDSSIDLAWDDTAKVLEVGGDIDLDDGGTYTTTLQTITPTAARTISFPDATGTVALVAGSSGQLVYNNAGAQAGAPGSVVGATGDITLGLNGAASTPPLDITGTWFTGGTGTTTKPQVLIEPTGATSTAWSTSGTGLGVNAASGFAGNLLDLQVNGTYYFRVNSTGLLSLGPGTGLQLQGASGSSAKKIQTYDGAALSINALGNNVGIGTSSPSAVLDVNSDTLRLRTARTPASATATGNAGDHCWDADYIYVCTATDTWKRTAISTW
jgi:hypothetical protein